MVINKNSCFLSCLREKCKTDNNYSNRGCNNVCNTNRNIKTTPYFPASPGVKKKPTNIRSNLFIKTPANVPKEESR